MQPTRIVVATAALVVAAAVPAAAQREDTFRWSGPLAAGKTLEVRGINGSIDARPAAGGMVEIVAHKEGKDDDPGAVDIEVVEGADGIRVCAVYPGKHGGRVNSCREGNHGDGDMDNDVVVDFTISVPTGVAFHGTTVNGSIDVATLRSDVRVSTVNGGIDVAATGTVEAETVNGSITLTLPAGTNASVSAQTVNGGFSSDFPLTVEAGRWGPKRVSGTIGSGGGRLNLETVNGGITIRKS